MPIYLNNKSYTLAIGNTPIEKLGGEEKVTFSMYGEEPPLNTQRMLTFTINPTPSNAKVIINGEETTTIILVEGSEINWSVSADGYTTQTNTLIIDTNTTIDIVLSEKWKQKENFEDNGVTYTKSGSNVKCLDYQLNNVWKNGYNNVTTLPSSWTTGTYPSIEQKEMSYTTQKLTIVLPEEITLKAFKLITRWNASTGNVYARVRVKDSAQNIVFNGSKIAGSTTDNPMTYSKSGSFKAKTIEFSCESSDGKDWKATVMLFSLILTAE